MIHDYSEMVAKLRPDQLVCAITGLFVAIGQEPELTDVLAERGRLAARELCKRLPRRRRSQRKEILL